MHDFMMDMFYMNKLWFRYHYYDITSYIFVMIIIMKLLSNMLYLGFQSLLYVSSAWIKLTLLRTIYFQTIKLNSSYNMLTFSK